MACGVSYETVAKRNFRFSKHTVYDDIKSVCAQPVHKVKADWDERSREPVGNVRLKGCLVHVDAARAASSRSFLTHGRRILCEEETATRETKMSAVSVIAWLLGAVALVAINNGSTFCPIHPRESSVSRGNSCSGIRNSRFVEVRLSTRYGTMISNQRTSTLVHADTHTGLSCAWSLFKSRFVHFFLIVRFARGLCTLVKSRSLKRGTESCSVARFLVHSRNNVYRQHDSSCLEPLAINPSIKQTMQRHGAKN
ncbi:hypothetical protein ALC53_03284 [Atta colombica]|uniref:Uncharacterized protein n=1 Tax=Atta colombica TaxID=520822 RepID=A0A195BNP5_9HYME|nr:hypothetical protein ALC53_03284 [Atta colombica]